MGSPGPLPRDICDVAADLGFADSDIDLHGRYRAKVHLDATTAGPNRLNRYVLVTGTTPTALGNGKSVTVIGLAMALRRAGLTAVATLRESARGPTFGLKGGGAGGGAAYISPLSQCLLDLTDTPAVESATNLLAAVVDDAVHRGGAIAPTSVTWRRAIDVNDRALRRVIIGLGGRINGPLRETGFDITAASEVMAVLALSRDRRDLRDRLGALVPAWDPEGKPVTAAQLGAAGAMAAVLHDAVQPNLMQTVDGTPVFIHAGPFGNLATGNSSVIADRLAVPRADYVVTEAGFGAELGAEKFFDLKCPVLGRYPDVAILVTTLRALNEHGTANLRHHIGILLGFGVPVIVAINRFPDDTNDEIQVIREAAEKAGAAAVAGHSAYVDGADGCMGLAQAVAEVTSSGRPTGFRPLYDMNTSCEQKVEAIATRIYGAAGVQWEDAAKRDLARFEGAGFGSLPVCMAKTPLSLSHDPKLLGAPTGFTLPVREIRLAAGAGYLTVLCGEIMTMPGLPAHPHLLDIDVNAAGEVIGLA